MTDPRFDLIPEALRRRCQWVIYRTKPKPNGKLDKIPHNPVKVRCDEPTCCREGAAPKNHPASVSDPGTWGSFEEAATAYHAGGWAGIGFVFTADDPYFGLDLDGVIDPETGDLSPDAAAIVAAFDTYTEPSPSGRGIHAIGEGTVPPGGNKRGNVELYDRGRFFTMTGRPLPGLGEIRPVNGALTALHRQVFGEPKPKMTTSGGGADRPALNLADAEVLERARRCPKTGARFVALYDRGDTSAYAGDGNDGRSEADAALCARLWFWTGGDEAQVDRLFRAGALYRPKWDRADYRERTLALVRDGAVYTPGGATPEPGESAQADEDLRAEVARLREVVAVQAARIAELERGRDADVTAAVQSYNRAIMRTLASEATPAKKVGMIALTAEAHSNRTGDLLSLEGMAKRYHVGEDTLRTVRDAYAPDLFTVESTYLTCSPYTGEVHNPPKPYSRTVPTKASPAETLTAMVEGMPETFKPAEQQPRTKPLPPTAPASTPPCPEDGDVPVTTARREVDVTSCGTCGQHLAAVVDDVVLTLSPEPTHPAQANADPSYSPSVVTGISPASVGPGSAAWLARHEWIDERVRRAATRAEVRRDGGP